MSDINLDTPSFGIVDTIASSSQTLVDDFLNDKVATTNPDDVKSIEEEETPKKTPKTTTTKEEVKEEKEEEKPFSFDDLKDEDEEEDVEEKPSKDKKPTAETTEEKEDGDFNPFSSFSKELYKIGAFVGPEEGEPTIPTTPEEFLEAMNTQVNIKAETAVDNFIGKFGEDYQKAFEAIFVNGADPKDYFKTYTAIENFAQMDLTSEANQELVARQALQDMEYEPEDIDKEIERLKQYADLEEYAKRQHKVLIKKEAHKLQRIEDESKTKLSQEAAVKRQFATNVSTILQDKLKAKDFDGIPINPKLATEIQDMLLSEKWKNKAGKTLTDFDVELLNLDRPENHELKVKYALILKMLKTDPSLSSIKKAGVTKQTNKLFEEVARQKSKTVTATKTDNAHWSNL